MMKLRPKRFSRSFWKGSTASVGVAGEIKWEVRPGGMLVQKRDEEYYNCNCNSNQEKERERETLITIRVSTVSSSKFCYYDVTIKPTATFGELKMVVSVMAKMEAGEQRLVYRGREREDEEHLHMVGVGDKDKVLLLEDPRRKKKKVWIMEDVASSSSPPAYNRTTITV